MSALTIARTNCILISDKLHPQKTKCILIFTLAAREIAFGDFGRDAAKPKQA